MKFAINSKKKKMKRKRKVENKNLTGEESQICLFGGCLLMT